MSRSRRRRRRVALTLPPASDIRGRLAPWQDFAGPELSLSHALSAGRENGKPLADQFLDDFGGALLARDEADALAGHQGPPLDIAVDHRTTQGPSPEMLDFELRFPLRELTPRASVDDSALHGGKPFGCSIGESANRDHRKARIELDRSDRITRRGPDKGLLKARVSDRFMRANKAGAELDAGGAHFEIGQHRFPAANAARYENWDIGEMRQNLLSQHAGRDRSDMPARLAAFYDDRIGAHAHEFARKPKGRCETHDPSAAPLDCAHRGTARQAAGQLNVADAMLCAYLDQFGQLRVQGDQIDAERPPGQRRRRVDLRGKQLRRHRPRGDDPEPAGIRYGGDQVALGYPGHRAAHNGEIAAEDISATGPQSVELGADVLSFGFRLAGWARFGRCKLCCAYPLGHPAVSSP